MVLSKNTLSCRIRIDLRPDHMDGHLQDIQELKDLTTVQLEAMYASEELCQTLISSVVFMQESTFLEQMLRSCQANGSIRSDHASELKLVIITGLQGIYY